MIAVWLLIAVVLSAITTAQRAAKETGFAYRPARTHPVWIAGLITAWLLIVLAPATASLAWGRERSAPASAARAMLLIVPGFLLALSVGLVLDVMGVKFLPPG